MKNHELRARIATALFACLNAAVLLSGCASIRSDAPSPVQNPQLLDLPQGKWVKIHQQHPGDTVSFERQRHGGSAFDNRRGQLVLFGSDTHDIPEGNWLNGPLVFDLKRLEWDQPYPPDPVSSYRVTPAGLPVAGLEGNHPWAMHTFGAVTYDPTADTIVVSSLPAHLKPGRFTSALASVWPQVKRHPTWLWHPDSGQWEPLTGDAVHFFANATAYDNRRNAVLGSRSDGIYALPTAEGHWRQIAEGGLLGWGNSVVFDLENGVLIAYGSHRRENHVVVYDPATGLHRRMPTPGPRPPGRNYVPMAFHPGIGQTVVLISRQPGPNAPFGVTETWLYDYSRDSWAHLEHLNLPFGIGMNYNLEYDPGHDLLLLVAAPPDRTLPAVWALGLGGVP